MELSYHERQLLKQFFSEADMRKRTSESLRIALKKAITTGFMWPGCRVEEGYLSQLFDVSKTTVREAIMLLDKENFLFYDPRSGYRVREPSLAEIIELNEFLLMLSVCALQRVYPPGPEARAMIVESVKNPEPGGIAKDRRFHLTLAIAGRNNYVLSAMSDAYDKLFWGMKTLGLRDFDGISHSVTAIQQAITADPGIGLEALETMMKEHFDARMNIILSRGAHSEM